MPPASGSDDGPGPDAAKDEAATESSAETGSRRGRSSKVTRETILRTALQEFAEQGYEGATTASIARKVGVTQPLVHYHFGSKEALWRATVDSIFGDLAKEVESAEARVEGMVMRRSWSPSPTVSSISPSPIPNSRA